MNRSNANIFRRGLCQRIAILRALQLGDLLCAVPAWRALRAFFPDAHIALIGLPWARAFVARFARYVDEFIEFPGFPGLPERVPLIRELPSFFVAMQKRRFDCVLQMHGNGMLTNPIIALMGARTCAGYVVPGQYCPHPSWFLPYPEGEPEVWRHLRLMEFLGVPLQGDQLEFPLTDRDEEALAAIEETAALHPGEFVCLHAGSRSVERMWPAEEFAKLGDALAAQGLAIVLTGTAEERALGWRIGQAMRAPVVNLIGRTSLGALGALMSRARLLVANDTAVSHLASALGLPSVIVVTGSDPMRWGPLNRERHRVLVGRSTTADRVMTEIEDLLNSLASAPCSTAAVHESLGMAHE